MKEKNHKGLPWFGIPKLIPYLRGYGRLFLSMVLFGLLASGMDVVIPLFQQYAINHFIADSTMQGIWPFVALYLLVMAVQTASNYISAYGACRAELYIGRDLRREAFDHVQTLSFSYFNQNSVGYIHARVISDTDRIAGTLAWGIMEGVWEIAYLLFAIVMMFALNWKLALCVMVIVPILVVSSIFFQKKLVFYHRKVREHNSQITSAFNEGITGAKTTKTLVIEDKVEKEFDQLTGEMKRVSVRAMHFRSVFMSTTAFAASIALAIVLWRGGIITREGVMLVGTLSVFMNYAQGMMEPIQWLAFASNAFNVLAPFYTDIDTTPGYLSGTTGKVSTENFYWMSRMIAAMADASYNKSVFHIERYQEKVAAKSHELLNRYDTLLEQETDEETRKKIQEEANEKIAGMLQCEAADTLDKVLYELSGQMKNAYARSDA